MARIALTGAVPAIVLALMGLMADFLGRRGPDLVALNQGLAIWSALAVALGIWLIVRLRGRGPLSERLWQRLPAWLYVTLAGLLILTSTAEFALYLAERVSGTPTAFASFIPIIALTASCFCVAPAWATLFADDRPQRHDAP